MNAPLSLSITAMLLLNAMFSFSGPNEDLISACKQGNMEAVMTALNAGADVKFQDGSGVTALGYAYFWPEITKLLLDKGADPNGGSYPALVNAVGCYSVDVVRMLLDAGADPNKKGISDMSAFYQSLIDKEKEKGKKKANQALIKAYEAAKKSAVSADVYPLHNVLAGTNCVKILNMLIEKGMKMELPDGRNAIEIYANSGMAQSTRKETWAQAATGYANFGITVPAWVTNLTDEINASYEEMFMILVEHNKDKINKCDANGYPPIYHVMKRAVNTKYPKEVLAGAKVLINAGANVKGDAVTATEIRQTISTPLCLAVETGDLDIIGLIIDKGADINESISAIAVTAYFNYASTMGEGGKGYTPLVIAVMRDMPEVVKLLIEKGADLGAGTHGFAVIDVPPLKCLTIAKNKTPIYWAIEHGNPEVLNLIATNSVGVKLPEFSIRVMADVETSEDFVCKKMKKAKFSPSEWAEWVGNSDAEKKLSALGL